MVVGDLAGTGVGAPLARGWNMREGRTLAAGDAAAVAAGTVVVGGGTCAVVDGTACRCCGDACAA